MTMMNNMNQNASSTRPVMLKDVAEKLGMPVGSVMHCMCTHPRMAQKKVDLVRQTAKEMGYDKQAVMKYNGEQGLGRKWKCETRTYGEATCSCGKVFVKRSSRQVYCHECAEKRQKEYVRMYKRIVNGRSTNWYNGNFKTREEEIARMKELREMGYSNSEIAKAIGRCARTVRYNIGKQDPELSRQNVVMAQKYRAQKNAARKQYVVNKPIREYNKRVEQHNRIKAELAQLQIALLSEKPEIEQAAQTQIEFPMMQMKTLQPTALQ